jgi:hypothetical protein
MRSICDDLIRVGAYFPARPFKWPSQLRVRAPGGVAQLGSSITLGAWLRSYHCALYYICDLNLHLQLALRI